VIADGVVTSAVDVQFDLIWRRGSTDMPLASWMQHFPAPVGVNFYVPYEVDEDAPAIDFEAGDQLIYRYTGTNGNNADAYEPNGDNNGTGRDTQLTLPK
jgi:hypothetical protein